MQRQLCLDHSEDIHVEFMMNAVAKVVLYKNWQAIVEDDSLCMYEPLRRNVLYATHYFFQHTKYFGFGSEIKSGL
jgi:hypothetical protein